MEFLTISSFNGSWDAPLFDYETEDGSIKIVGWKGMKGAEETTPWQPVQVETDDGEELICAFPEDMLNDIESGDFTPNEAWLQFLNGAENWNLLKTYEIAESENRGSFDYVKFDASLKDAKRESVGNPAFERFNKVYGKTATTLSPNVEKLFSQSDYFVDDSPVAPAVETYKRFMKNALNFVAEKSDIVINNNASYKQFKDDDGKANFRVKLSNLHFNLDNVEKKWNRKLNDSLSTEATSVHKIVGDITLLERLRDDESGEEYWNTIKSASDITLANVPAMNLKNGMFLKDGSQYVIAFATNPAYDHKRFITPGMSLKNALEDGITAFNETLSERVATLNVNDTRGLDKLFSGVNMDSGFLSLYQASGKEANDDYSNDDVENKKDEDAQKDESEIVKKAPRKLSGQKVWYYAKANNEVCGWRDVLTVHMREETPNVHPYLTGIVDYSAAPEGKNAPIQGRLTNTVRFDDDGVAYNPFYKVENGKIDESKVVWMPMLNDSTTLRDGVKTIESSIMVHAGDINNDGTFRTSKDGRVPAQRGDDDMLVDPSKIDYVAISTKYEHTPGSETGTDPSRIYGVRMIIKNSGQKDAVMGEKSQTRSFIYRSERSDKNRITVAEGDGVVESIDKGFDSVGNLVPQLMTLLYDNGKRVEVDLREKEMMNTTNVSYQWLADGVKEGMRFKRGQILTNTSGTEYGELTMGAAATVAFVSAGATTTDDCVAVSSEWAKKNTIRYAKEVDTDLQIGVNASPYGPDLIFNPTLGSDNKIYNGYDLSRLGDDGIVKDGESISQGDVVAWRLVPDGTKLLSAGEQLAMSKPKKGVPFTDIPLGYKAEPVFFDKAMEDGKAKVERYHEREGYETLKIVAIKDKPLETGDKISISGVKATIKVLNDDEYLKILSPSSSLDGHTVDIFFSTGFSVLKRKAPGIMIDGLLGSLSVENKKLYDLGFDSTGVRESVSSLADGTNGQKYLVGKIDGKNISTSNPIKATVGVLQVMNVDKKAIDHIYKSYYNEKMVDESKEKSVKVVVQMNTAVAEAQGAYNIIAEDRKYGKSEKITDDVSRAILATAGFGVVDNSVKNTKKQKRKIQTATGLER